MNGFQSNFALPSYAPAMQSKGKEPVTEQFDEAAFERAFDMAREDMMVDETLATSSQNVEEIARDVETSQEAHGVTKGDVRNMNDILAQGDRLEDFDFDSFLDQKQPDRQAFDLKEEEPLQEEAQTKQIPQKHEQEHTADEDDALAATAKELLEKVDHNQTDKFKNSQFLGLMRKLRDREMKVEGDKMVETVSAPQTQNNMHPKRIATPDSGYDSGMATPPPPDAYSHNPTLCKAIDCDLLEAHRWDHWESPYT